MEEQDVKRCCATFYGSDFARLLLGDSFHPGGTRLTERLGAFHLAESFACKVAGVDLSEENVHLATADASQRGLAEQISFQLGDAERLPFGDETFDAIICECAFCTFPCKW